MNEEEIREFRSAPTIGTLEFDYENWRGEKHHYVVDFERPTGNCGWDGSVPSYRSGELVGGTAGLSGWLILRDDDPRPEMDENRRRSFELTKMENVQRVSAERLLTLTQTGSVEEAVRVWDQRKHDSGN